ncbi:MAG TPA: metallophosphoesterase [Cyclobacteriaceae bacterium]|nr:metallophosphoesterase [Cyclobacteriaceae bacterium]
MPLAFFMAVLLNTVTPQVRAQIPQKEPVPERKEIAFVSDTQAPLWVENIFLKSNHNREATGLIFQDIIKNKPKALFILGDVVSLGYREAKWKNIDKYLQACRENGIEFHALLGNHDVMGRPHKGESNFQKRFPDHIRTGYVSVVDSVGVVMVNSNFGKLTSTEIDLQQKWYEETLKSLDKDPKVKVVIVTCHHAPYSNSKLVGSSKPVQEHFVPAFLSSKKAELFITGHSHTFEHFKIKEKDFLVIGGGGGLHQPLNGKLEDTAVKYKPMFHYLTVLRTGNVLHVISHFLKDDFSGFDKTYEFSTAIPKVTTAGSNLH